MSEETFAALVAKKLNKNFRVMKRFEDEKETYYAHPTFFVKSLHEYIQLVTSIASLNISNLDGDTIVFRGMANSRYNLSPGLSRMKNLDFATEQKLINEFLTHRPDAFKDLCDFDIMAKMQHYGLPTRLLDFSTNSLVALYFACESQMTKNGLVLCHLTYLYNDSDCYVSEICSAAIRKTPDFNYFIEEYLDNENFDLNRYLIRAYLCGHTTVVKPKYWNQRIANQAGVFMLFPNNLTDRYRNILMRSAETVLPSDITDFVFGKVDEDIIRGAHQKEPLSYYVENENDAYLTNECFKKMYESYKSKSKDEDFWDKNKKYFENRFKMSYDLKLIDDSILKNCFCSIIVDSKSKKKILQELSCIGIREDYIYPELEYTAKEIKRHYK